VISNQWQSIDTVQHSIPSELFPWLSCQTSLTEKLQQHTAEPVYINVLGEKECLIGEHAHLLQEDDSAKAICRQVYLESAGLKWIAARTIVPYATWQKVQLGELGERPIGILLFDEVKNSHRSIEISLLKPIWSGFDKLPHADNGCWARRSIFWIKHYPILIYELFGEGLDEKAR